MFNLKRLGQLIRINFYLQRKLIWILAIGFGLLYLWVANTPPAFSLLFNLTLFIGGVLLTASAFREVHDPGTSIQTLTLPCSALERYVALWLLTGPLYLIALTLLYGLGILVHVLGQSYWGSWSTSLLGLGWITLKYLLTNAVFLWGSVCFKRQPLAKTILCVLLLWIILLVFHGILPQHLQVLSAIGLIFWMGLGILAWVAGYLQLKRIELK